MKIPSSLSLNPIKNRPTVFEKPSLAEKLPLTAEFKNKFQKLNSDLLRIIFKRQNAELFSPFLHKKGIQIKYLKKETFFEDYYQTPKIEIQEKDKESCEFELDNSLFISAISALIETPNILLSLIEVSNSNRFFIVYLNQNGIWRELCLDLYLVEKIDSDFIRIPEENNINSSGKKSLLREETFKFFSRLKNNALWLKLLEKAYALAYGSYYKMLNCLIEDILYDFTGAVVETHETKSMNHYTLGDLLIKDFNKGSPMILIEKDLKERLNDLYSHNETLNQWALPIIDVKNTKTEYIIVKVRNLNRLIKNKLKYDKNSNEWPPDLKAELAINFDPPDIIWLSIEEIKEIFSNLIICKVNQENHHKNLLFEFTNIQALSYGFASLEMPAPFNVGITLCQDDLREYKPEFKYKYSKLRLLVCKIIKKENSILTKFVAGTVGEKRNISIDLLLERGSYIIFFEIEWIRLLGNASKQINLNIYSNSQIVVHKIKEIEEMRKNFLANTYFSVSNIQNFQIKNGIQNYFQKISNDISLIYGSFLDYFYLVIKNCILLKKHHKITLKIAALGCFYTDLNLEEKDFSSKDIKIFLPASKNLILIFNRLNSQENAHIHPKIKKSLKVIENLKKSTQNYEIKSMDSDCFAQFPEKNLETTSILDAPDNEIIYFVKKVGKMQKRTFPGNNAQIYFWIAALNEGIAVLIENLSDSITYYEKLSYETDGLIILPDINDEKVKYYNGYLEITISDRQPVIIKWRKKSNVSVYSYIFKNKFEIEQNAAN